VALSIIAHLAAGAYRGAAIELARRLAASRLLLHWLGSFPPPQPKAA